MVDVMSLAHAPNATAAPVRWRIQVQGVVQGVGFRPFVHRLAQRLNLSGSVLNDSAGVLIEVEGESAAVAIFRQALSAEAPPLARIDNVTTSVVPVLGSKGFAILHSESSDSAQTLVSPDIALCDDCLRELFDPTDRRYRYPFINCTNCGPRFTIIQGVPYDRPRTTMAEFALCSECAGEYCDPGDRRFHAQPNACPTCGPRLLFQALHERVSANPFSSHFSFDSTDSSENALYSAQCALVEGHIVAVKGIGGFHLACDATNNEAVQQLRQRKHRGDKPFAILARDLAAIEEIASLSPAEISLLASPERPIVLLNKRAASPLSVEVAPGNPLIGVMLPYAPIHYLLFNPHPEAPRVAMPKWLVMTSANHADEPILTDNADAAEKLSDLADAVLMNNRPIHTACDDSVMAVFGDTPLPIRRSRGYAPLPCKLPVAVPLTLGVGGEIKNTFCLARGRQAIMSQHIGDMETLETQESFSRSVDHLQTLFHVQPELYACDLHPGYHSTRWAEKVSSARQATLVKVQHHHAHIAALMAEHGLHKAQQVIGFCFDGTGYGTDGAIWGGEVMVADYAHFERIAHLKYFPLLGGDASIRKPYRMALASLWAAGSEWDERIPAVAAASLSERANMARQLQTGQHCVPTSSMGRLFDAVASLCGVRHIATYEAQAAIEFEALAAKNSDSYRFDLISGMPIVFDPQPVIAGLVSDYLSNVPVAIISSRFHNAVAALILDLAHLASESTGIRRIALSGGVFQNFALLERTVAGLHKAHFETLIHRTVPPNDGGLALGQAIIAAHSIKQQGD
jgi:hydrogenase maturation protein HypF